MLLSASVKGQGRRRVLYVVAMGMVGLCAFAVVEAAAESDPATPARKLNPTSRPAGRPARVRESISASAGGSRALATTRPAEAVEGFRGIWYPNQETHDEYAYKYSGGMATYPQQHEPIAVYSAAAKKTFFVYGGTSDPENLKPKRLQAMISCYDHTTGLIARPRMIVERGTIDAHENPVLGIDADGRLFVFVPSHGGGRPAFIYRSVRPFDISAFELVRDENFSYPQPWFLDGGWTFLHTIYNKGRRQLYVANSDDGRTWTKSRQLAAVENGHYQVSWPNGKRLGTAFNFHPTPEGLNARTNLYYMETADRGQTWQTAGGEKVELPLTTPNNAALIRDYRSMRRLVYVKDINYDADGRPVIVYVTSGGWKPGPTADPRTVTLAHWMGSEWQFIELGPTDHNYDTGCLHIEGEVWRMVLPVGAGPQPYGCGGEVGLWTSRDAGHTWDRRVLTHNSPRNHNYMRRPLNAQPEFYAIWSDGDARKPSESHLYFCNREGRISRMPWKVDQEWVRPEPVE
jgi:hypothetical protein